jgi:hypothetical protein
MGIGLISPWSWVQIPLSPFLKKDLIRFWFFVFEERYDSGIAREYR